MVVGLYGIKRDFKNLAFYIDNKTEFEIQLNKAIDSSTKKDKD